MDNTSFKMEMNGASGLSNTHTGHQLRLIE